MGQQIVACNGHLSGKATYQDLAARCQYQLLVQADLSKSMTGREFISARWTRQRHASGLREVLNAEHLKAAHNASRQRHHM
jgi:hypothetical protein